jgi:AraC family transcriptional regulator
VSGASTPEPAAIVLRPGVAVLAVRAAIVDVEAPVLAEHAVYVNVGRPYRLVETLDGVVRRTPGVPGDVAVVPAGASLRTVSADGSPQQVESLAFLVAPGVVEEVLDAAGATARARAGGSGLVPVVGARSPAVAQLATLVGAALPDPTPLGRLALESLGHAVAVSVVREHTRARGAASVTEHGPAQLSRRQLDSVLRRIESDLAAPLAVADLAAVAHVSPFHFARLFRASTGESPHQYLLQRRVDRARELLLGSALPLPEVATRCGFADQSHLTRHLRRRLGTTPGALRADAAAR